MNTDTFFTQGNSHRVCQDYAIHGPNYVIISDGCSSAPDTDFGARLMAKAAQHNINQSHLESWYQLILNNAEYYAKGMDLNVDSLFATLLMAKVEEDTIKVAVRGDGAVAVKYKGGDLDGCIAVMKTVFPDSAPPYLRYFLNGLDTMSYFGSAGKREYQEHYYILFPDKMPSNLEIHPREFTPDFESYPTYEFKKSAVECIAVFSDGVSAFQEIINKGSSKSTILVPEYEIIREMMAFRGYQGEFVQRRCQRAFDTFDKNGWVAFDDFSIGVIYTG